MSGLNFTNMLMFILLITYSFADVGVISNIRYTPFEKLEYYYSDSGIFEDQWIITVLLKNRGTASGTINTVNVSMGNYSYMNHVGADWRTINPIKYCLEEKNPRESSLLIIPVDTWAIIRFNVSRDSFTEGENITVKIHTEKGMDYYQNMVLESKQPDSLEYILKFCGAHAQMSRLETYAFEEMTLDKIRQQHLEQIYRFYDIITALFFVGPWIVTILFCLLKLCAH